jgi:hypothetical protein
MVSLDLSGQAPIYLRGWGHFSPPLRYTNAEVCESLGLPPAAAAQVEAGHAAAGGGAGNHYSVDDSRSLLSLEFGCCPEAARPGLTFLALPGADHVLPLRLA